MKSEESTGKKTGNSDKEMASGLERTYPSQPERYEDVIDGREADHEKQLQRAQRDAATRASQAVKEHLAYRLGLQLVRAFRNPLRLLALPYSLTREWLSFRRSAGKLTQKYAISNKRTMGVMRQQTPLSLDMIRDLESDSLIELSEKELLDALAAAKQGGEPELEARLAAARWRKTGTEEAAYVLRQKKGRLVELSPGWFPTLPRQSTRNASPHKILHIFRTVYPLESNQNAVRNRSIIRQQKAIGLDPVISVTPTGMADDPIIDRAGRDGVFARQIDGIETWFCHFQHMPRQAIPRDTLLTFDAKILAHICAQVKPSIVHAASDFPDAGNALTGLAVSKSHGIPFVYDARWFRGHESAYLSGQEHETPTAKLRARQEITCLAEADAVVAVSNAMAADLERSGIAANKITVVPDGIDERFLETVSEKTTKTFKNRWRLNSQKVIACISDFSKRESLGNLIEAFALLRQHRPEAHLLLIGDGPGRKDLEQHVSKLGLGGAAIFTGSIENEELRAAYSSVDLFVVPELPGYASGFVMPITPMEAMAMQCPLVIADYPESRELIGDQERGLLFKAGDAESLRSAFETVFQDAAATAHRSAQARRWVEQCCRWPANARLYESIYARAREEHRNAVAPK